MIDSLYIGATGMHAQQTNLDVIANNLANVNTAGYKKNKINFEDLMYRTLSVTNGIHGPVGNNEYMGAGSAIASTEKIFTQGDIKNTQNQLDLAIQGTGFFEVELPDGNFAYTRNGSFKLDNEGYLVNSSGHRLSAKIQLPADSASLTIQKDGIVLATLNSEVTPAEVGKIELAYFVNPSSLTPMGDNLYQANRETGPAQYGEPGTNGTGTLAQGFQEGSNVDLISEMLNLILAQRAYEINSRIVQASDEMLGLANNIRR
jgi:flagellar basal-body rod protein FlgG